MSSVASERVVNGIKTRVLHGKDYVEVAERVRIAHSGDAEFEQEDTEQFSIETRWFVRCIIRVKGKKYIGTAEIKFLAPKNTPDGTNPYECAETSALGRALAFAGLGTVESIASFDEVYRVQSIEEAEMNGRPVVEAAKPKQIAPPVAPMAPSDEPSIDPSIKRMIDIAKSRVAKIGLDWEAVKQEALKRVVADHEVKIGDFVHINGLITKHEKAAKSA